MTKLGDKMNVIESEHFAGRARRTTAMAGGALCLLALLVTGCGAGGNDAPGTKPAIGSAGPEGTTSPTTPTNPANPGVLAVTLALKGTDTAASASTTVSLGKSLQATATVLDKTGKPAANALLTFAVDPLVLGMAPTAGQIATDSAGKASVTLAPAGIAHSGATLLTVLAQYGGETARSETVVTVAPPVLSIARVAPQASPSPVAAYGAAVITLDVLNDGALLAALPVTINLASTCAAAGRAILPATVTTVQGRAQFTWQDKGCAQSDTVTATIDGSNAATTVTLAVASPDAASIEVGDIAPANASIVIQGAGGSGRTETARVRFRVLDKTGAPVVNQNVAFSTISTKAVRLAQTSGVTDGNGDVFANLISGTEPTAVRVVATLSNGLSTVSDTITVTTGLPVQLAFSLSAQSFNIEGFEYDDVADEIKVLLADQFSNPVADGTPVVLQTDSGAIGTSTRGGCVTVNGRCTVDLRSQSPRYGTDAGAPQQRAGLATITATTLNGTGTSLDSRIAVFLSGSRVRNISLAAAPPGVVLENGNIIIDTASCGAVNFSVRMSDARRNPLPSTSTLSFENTVLMTGASYPATVPNVAPAYTGGFVTGDQGSVHTLAIQPDNATCEVGGPKASSGSASLVLTTPRGNATLVPVVIRFRGKADTP